MRWFRVISDSVDGSSAENLQPCSNALPTFLAGAVCSVASPRCHVLGEEVCVESEAVRVTLIAMQPCVVLRASLVEVWFVTSG